MKNTPIDIGSFVDTLPLMPPWISSGRAETLEDAAFLSGAALSVLHLVVTQDDVPHALLRDRLALWAAEACVVHTGRPERAADLRDAVHLLRPGDQPGPAGAIYQMWRQAVVQPLSGRGLHKALPEWSIHDIASWLDAGRGRAVSQAASVLETVLQEAPRAEAEAMILADAALARALGWGRMVPLLAAGLTPRDLHQTGDDLRLACHRTIVASATDTVRRAAETTRRAHRLKAIVPKLRARGAGAAVDMFLTRDAVAPAALPLPDRAARRLCDRLVDLGVVRELTGRDTFRLYGV
ncbi:MULTISPECIES: DUF1403 family protein [Roseobacteraceae]|uniref:DUF1403 family protein n=1 Tax=Pseudosulfitobacter pseudonitzschiae TaxID=1402135 RepID=A0A221K690_9RHOB|nr:MULTISPECIES: DUF1403 family protein [Roseobacteraceae]ASM74521.1 hypothetical protein SULPSESMR1_04825 [Pseudosulfitobacter pseudonitzschiae]